MRALPNRRPTASHKTRHHTPRIAPPGQNTRTATMNQHTTSTTHAAPPRTILKCAARAANAPPRRHINIHQRKSPRPAAAKYKIYAEIIIRRVCYHKIERHTQRRRHVTTNTATPTPSRHSQRCSTSCHRKRAAEERPRLRLEKV